MERLRKSFLGNGVSYVIVSYRIMSANVVSEEENRLSSLVFSTVFLRNMFGHKIKNIFGLSSKLNRRVRGMTNFVGILYSRHTVPELVFLDVMCRP